jgi:hypothetical protein
MPMTADICTAAAVSVRRPAETSQTAMRIMDAMRACAVGNYSSFETANPKLTWRNTLGTAWTVTQARSRRRRAAELAHAGR